MRISPPCLLPLASFLPSKKSTVEHRGVNFDTIATLSKLINTRSDTIDKMVSLKIEGLQKNIHFPVQKLRMWKARWHSWTIVWFRRRRKWRYAKEKPRTLKVITEGGIWVCMECPNLRMSVRRETIRICQAVLPEEKSKSADVGKTFQYNKSNNKN